jgi:hypothetical protein
MTPKEKADELVTKYRRCLPMNLTTMLDAKNCALIAVDEQISLYNELNQLGLLKDNSIGFELAELKEEINKL